jgi:hypothetical protein
VSAPACLNDAPSILRDAQGKEERLFRQKRPRICQKKPMTEAYAAQPADARREERRKRHYALALQTDPPRRRQRQQGRALPRRTSSLSCQKRARIYRPSEKERRKAAKARRRLFLSLSLSLSLSLFSLSLSLGSAYTSPSRNICEYIHIYIYIYICIYTCDSGSGGVLCRDTQRDSGDIPLSATQ